MPHYRGDGTAKAWPINQPETLAVMQTCVDACTTTHESCSEADETSSCYSCSVDCTESFDSEILSCIKEASTSTKSTYGTNQDSCANSAGYKATTCMETCYGSDIYQGWTPETEIGLPEEMRSMSKFSVPEPRLAPERKTSRSHNKQTAGKDGKEGKDATTETESAAGTVSAASVGGGKKLGNPQAALQAERRAERRRMSVSERRRLAAEDEDVHPSEMLMKQERQRVKRNARVFGAAHAGHAGAAGAQAEGASSAQQGGMWASLRSMASKLW